MRFGEPIVLDFFASRYLAAPDADAARAVIKSLTAEVEKRLIDLTINAPDWCGTGLHCYYVIILMNPFRDTWFAASIARDIAWKGSENVPTKDWVTVSQK